MRSRRGFGRSRHSARNMSAGQPSAPDINAISAAPGSLERRLVELEEATMDAIGELEAAVRSSRS